MNGKPIQSVALSIAFLQDNQPVNIRLLEIPYYMLLTFSTKPRKWLFYAAYAILGVNGTLYLDYPRTLDLEGGVEPGDHFTYHADDEPIYVDLEGRTDDSYSSGWATVPTEFGDYYGGCPFSRRMIGACGAGHLVPLAKGTHFLRDLLRLRGERDDNIDIDDPSNILVMRADIHKVYHEQKTVAFLRTPNIVLKSNELPGAEDTDADSYRVTLHCFDGEDPKTSNHGDFSDLGRRSGKRNYLSSGYPKDLSEEFRPKDAILDVTYGYHLLRSWGTGEARKVLAEHKNSLTGYSPPCDCHPVRQKRRPDEEEDDEDSSDNDAWDLMFAISYLARNTSPKKIAEQEEKARQVERDKKARHIDEWRGNVSNEFLSGATDYDVRPSESDS